MSRDEFVRELEYLLSDISEEDKAEAIGYYKDYLDEAGPDEEERVIREFGSPERIAAIIRSDLSGNMEAGGEFTENGYEDVRFKDPNYQMAKRYDLPESTVEDGKHYKEEVPFRTNRTVKIILWIILIIVASPVIFGIGGGAIGLVSGLLGLFVAAVVILGITTAIFLIVGFALLIVGIVYMVASPLNGILLLGVAILLLGVGILLVAVCVLFYGRFIPFLIRTIVEFFSRLLNGRRKNV